MDLYLIHNSGGSGPKKRINPTGRLWGLGEDEPDGKSWRLLVPLSASLHVVWMGSKRKVVFTLPPIVLWVVRLPYPKTSGGNSQEAVQRRGQAQYGGRNTSLSFRFLLTQFWSSPNRILGGFWD